jgi:uncharacterized protein (TIGR02996 family)
VDRAESLLQQALLAPDERPLLLAIVQKSKDADQRKVYADWLEEHGSPESTARAEFLRLRLTRKPAGADDARNAREAKLRAQIAPAWLSLIGDTRATFRPWQERVATDAADYIEGGWRPVPGLTVKSNQGLLDVVYSGSWESEVLDFLASRTVAPVLHSLRLVGGHWHGANGVREIYLDSLLPDRHEFSNLELFEVTQKGEHGMPWIGGLDGEGGALGKFLKKAPALQTLISPSAPDRTFFQAGERPIEWLDIVAGSEHQNFIANLARSRCFPQLRVLLWNDANHTYMNNWRDYCTPFDDYLALFQSPAIANVERLVLRDVNLTAAQIRQLRDIRSEGVTIRRIREYG